MDVNLLAVFTLCYALRSFLMITCKQITASSMEIAHFQGTLQSGEHEQGRVYTVQIKVLRLIDHDEQVIKGGQHSPL